MNTRERGGTERGMRREESWLKQKTLHTIESSILDMSTKKVQSVRHILKKGGD